LKDANSKTDAGRFIDTFKKTNHHTNLFELIDGIDHSDGEISVDELEAMVSCAMGSPAPFRHHQLDLCR
jgi:hypothetical protein